MVLTPSIHNISTVYNNDIDPFNDNEAIALSIAFVINVSKKLINYNKCYPGFPSFLDLDYTDTR